MQEKKLRLTRLGIAAQLNLLSLRGSVVISAIIPANWNAEVKQLGNATEIKGLVARLLRMNIHKNVRLTPLRREEMAVAVLNGRLSKAKAASLYGVSMKIVSRWSERFRIGGLQQCSIDHRAPYIVRGRLIMLRSNRS